MVIQPLPRRNHRATLTASRAAPRWPQRQVHTAGALVNLDGQCLVQLGVSGRRAGWGEPGLLHDHRVPGTAHPDRIRGTDRGKLHVSGLFALKKN
jgi:hypothetical protein